MIYLPSVLSFLLRHSLVTLTYRSVDSGSTCLAPSGQPLSPSKGTLTRVLRRRTRSTEMAKTLSASSRTLLAKRRCGQAFSTVVACSGSRSECWVAIKHSTKLASQSFAPWISGEVYRQSLRLQEGVIRTNCVSLSARDLLLKSSPCDH